MNAEAPAGAIAAARGKPKGLLRRLRKEFFLVPRWALYKVSRLWPRSAKRWVFGNHNGEPEGNPKALFLWMRLSRPDIKASWISDDLATRVRLRAAGYIAHHRWSPGGILAALRSGVFVYAHDVDTVNLLLSNGAFLLNLWHGVGLKGVKYGYEGSSGRLKRQQGRRGLARMRDLGYLLAPDMLVTTSNFMRDHFSSQFRLPSAQCPVLGYPRLDYAVCPELLRAARELDDRGLRLVEDAEFDEVYLYLPTYRDSHRPFLHDALPDLERLSVVLKGRNAVLYLKLHPHTKMELKVFPANIRVWPADVDIYPSLHLLDCLITDYSSVFYDFISVRKNGSILYTFDYEDYVLRDRTLLYPYDDNVAGLRATSFDELCGALRESLPSKPDISDRMTRVRGRFWGSAPTFASPEIVRAVFAALDKRR